MFKSDRCGIEIKTDKIERISKNKFKSDRCGIEIQATFQAPA